MDCGPTTKGNALYHFCHGNLFSLCDHYLYDRCVGHVHDEFPRGISVWQDLAVIPRQPARAGSNDILGRTFPAEMWDDFDLWIALEGRSIVEMMGVSRPFDAGTCL